MILIKVIISNNKFVPLEFILANKLFFFNFY